MYEKYMISDQVNINIKDDPYADKISNHFPEDEDEGCYRQFLTHNFMLNKLKSMAPAQDEKEGGIVMINVTHCLQVGWSCQLNQIYSDAYGSGKSTSCPMSDHLKKLFYELEDEVNLNGVLAEDRQDKLLTLVLAQDE